MKSLWNRHEKDNAPVLDCIDIYNYPSLPVTLDLYFIFLFVLVCFFETKEEEEEENSSGSFSSSLVAEARRQELKPCLP